MVLPGALGADPVEVFVEFADAQVRTSPLAASFAVRAGCGRGPIALPVAMYSHGVQHDADSRLKIRLAVDEFGTGLSPERPVFGFGSLAFTSSDHLDSAVQSAAGKRLLTGSLPLIRGRNKVARTFDRLCEWLTEEGVAAEVGYVRHVRPDASTAIAAYGNSLTRTDAGVVVPAAAAGPVTNALWATLASVVVSSQFHRLAFFRNQVRRMKDADTLPGLGADVERLIDDGMPMTCGRAGGETIGRTRRLAPGFLRNSVRSAHVLFDEISLDRRSRERVLVELPGLFSGGHVRHFLGSDPSVDVADLEYESVHVEFGSEHTSKGLRLAHTLCALAARALARSADEPGLLDTLAFAVGPMGLTDYTSQLSEWQPHVRPF